MIRPMPRSVVSASLLILLSFVLGGCERSTPPNASSTASTNSVSEQFLSLMNAGKNYLDQGDATNALAVYRKAAALVPHDADVHLNLAISHLSAGQAEEAIRESDQVLDIEPNSAAAYFVKGSSHLRLAKDEEAVKALENARKIDPGETATLFQLGLARMGLRQWEEAIAAFREGINMDPNHLHAAPHYLLAQALIRAGRQTEADQELQLHQTNIEGGGPAINAATFERSKFTQPRVPFALDQPEKDGILVKFTDSTQEVFGETAQNISGPLAIIDVNHTGWNSLFGIEKGQGFRLFWNSNGVFHPHGQGFPITPGVNYLKMLAGDLQNDRFDDIIVLGDGASRLFKFATNGMASDASAESRLENFGGPDGLLIDLNFTGKLDFLAIESATNRLRLFRQFGPLLFNDVTSTSGIPSALGIAQHVAMADWNHDQIMDLIVSRASGSPLLLEKQRGGPLIPKEETNWVEGAVFCAGDFDNDLRPDLAIASREKITICFNGGERKEFPLANASTIRQLVAFDYDNDGWLDLWAVGDTLRAWRNLGLSGFQERSSQIGVDKVAGAISEIHFADFDMDCDPDMVIALAGGGLRYLRNDGGNANLQIKVRMVGNRSNASGIGCKVEIQTGGLRLIRTVERLPVEIGVGKYQRLDSFLVHWFNWPQGSAELDFNCKEPILALELTIQEGSCPYLYAWDGNGFRFVTDILGAAPLGLPVAEGRYIEADPEELVWIGNEQTFVPRNGNYEIQITEELREALYLDEVRLAVVDHAPGMEAHPTDKLLPSKPFPKGAIWTFENEHPLLKAEILEGEDVTARLRSVDGLRISPFRLRSPQLRGLAESHGVILDFGPLDANRPLALVMNGWLRFGGGMANIAASHDPTFPFPFPTLEVETSPGVWSSVDVVVGAPAGKTKTIVVDLENKLPAGARRLRLSEAFEIHWDRIALMERQTAQPSVHFVVATEADLHFRGFSALKKLPADWPLTPDYDAVSANWYWTIIPGGWCTKYGPALELIAQRDEGLALINSGDELTLKFATASLPPKPAGAIREFFLYVDGWDKDSDFHVAEGARVEPLPFHGMDGERYGSEKRPKFPSDALHEKYNTRWVESRALKQTAKR